MIKTLWTRRRAALLPIIGLAGATAPIPNAKGDTMTDTPVRKSPFGDIAPALGEYTDNVLFGDVWKRPELSPRDRSLVTAERRHPRGTD